MDDHTPDTVGVDISKAHLDLHRRSTGESARLANDADGFEELAAWVGDPAVLVVYESTGPWHRDLEERLAGRLALARVNPLRARRFAQAMGEEAKTDAADARTLAAMGAAMAVRRVEPRSQPQRDLDELVTARDALVKDRTAALNREKHARHPLLRRQLKNRLAQIGRQIKALDDQIARTTAEDAGLSRRMEVLTSIAGVGRVVAAGLVGGISWAGATMSDMMRAFKPLRSRRRNNKRQPSRLPPLDEIEPVFVDQRPERFEHGKLYICGSGSWSGHLCACGCGEIIDVGFHDATWQMLFNGKVTIYPSIGNNHLPCRAHYVIRENKVVWYGYVPSLRSKRP